MVASKPSFLQMPHLLEWHACHCAAQVKICKQPRAERLLRALSVDLALEAEKYRRMVRQTTQIGGARSEQTRAMLVDLVLRAERSRHMDLRMTQPRTPGERTPGATIHQEVAPGQ